MASGFFGVTRPGRFELNMVARAHDGGERLALDLYSVRLPYPLAQGRIRRESFRLAPYWPRHRGRARGVCRRDIQLQQRIQPSRRIAGAPLPDGLAVETQQGRRILPCRGLSAPQEIERLPPRLLAPIAGTRSATPTRVTGFLVPKPCSQFGTMPPSDSPNLALSLPED
jgi:hypothetical protein